MKNLTNYLFCIALVTTLTDCSKNGTILPILKTNKVVFKNNTYTGVNLTFQGKLYTLAIGESLSFIEKADTNLSYSAITEGRDGTVADLGSHNIISSGGGQITNINLVVPNNYVYIVINNSSPSYTVSIMTYKFSNQGNTTYIYPIIIPNDGKNYGIMYVPVPNLSGVEAYNQNYSLPLTRLQEETPTWDFTPLPALSGSVNQELILNLK